MFSIHLKSRRTQLDNLRTYRAEIEDLLNSDIVLRHHYQEGVIEHQIVGDSTIIKAVELLKDKERYQEILLKQDTSRN